MRLLSPCSSLAASLLVFDTGQMAAIVRRTGSLVLQHLARHNRKTFKTEVRGLNKTAAYLGSCRDKKSCKVVFSQQELRKRLTPLQYHVTQEKGTESAFKGEFTNHKEEGTYTCVVCGTPVFKSETKFDSGSGWPSFFELIKQDAVSQTDDFSFGMHRVETSCSQCGAHLGHLFDDGPPPTGKRYCINSASLAFQAKAQAASASEEGAGKAEGGGTKSSPPGETAASGKTEL